jgi:radical SAM superfamily enzyme YgiQ (UPF0313 family)
MEHNDVTEKKKTDVLLINPPAGLSQVLGVGEVFVQKYEPLGLLYIAAVLLYEGYTVKVLDAYAEDLDIAAIKKYIHGSQPAVIGISTLTCSGVCVYELGKWLKQTYPEIVVVLGNVHASVFAEAYLKNKCCDIVVHGEGEYSMRDIIQAVYQQKSFLTVENISFLNEKGEYISTGPGATVERLDELPFPARELTKRSLYGMSEISNHVFIGRKGAIAKTMFTSRGCPNQCSFCVVHNNRRQRFHSPEYVVDEMESLIKEYGASYITIMDALFMGNTERVFRICEEIQKRKLSVQWGCDAHVRYVTPELVRAMSSAGCFSLDFGIESGVDRLLKKVNKGTTVEQARRAVAIVKDNSRIKITGLFILGLPTETYEESLQTIQFAKSLPLDMAQFSILTPYPGSPLFKELSEKGEIDTGWRENGALDPTVWPRYSAYVSFTQNDPIWVTPTVSAKQLKQLQKRAQREFYLRPRQIIQQMKRVRAANIGQIIRIALKGFF